MEAWIHYIIESKYHFSVAKRMFSSYKEYEDKMFLVGIIKEMGRSATNLLKAFLILEKRPISKDFEKDLKVFIEEIAPKYLEKEKIIHITKSLEVYRARGASRIEYAKGNKIILLINGKYRIITAKRLEEFSKSLEITLKHFPKNIRQV